MKIIRIFVIEGEGLYSIRYDKERLSEWHKIIKNWLDTQYIRNYLKAKEELFYTGYYNCTLSEAISKINQEAKLLFDEIIKHAENGFDNKTYNLQTIFLPYHPKDSAIPIPLYQETKAKFKNERIRQSFLRVYALRIDKNTFVVTGGAIKLSRSSQEDEDLEYQRQNFSKVKSFLFSQNIETIEDLIYYYEK